MSLNLVRPFDGTTYASIDSIVGALNVIDVVHHEIHAGTHFMCTNLWDDVADAGKASIWIETGAGATPHLIAVANCAGDAWLHVFEDTVGTAGTSLTPYNNNRGNSGTSEATLGYDGEIGSDGTTLFQALIPGGVNKYAGGGSGDSRVEWVLAPSTVYCVQVTNKGGGVKDVSLALMWYEES